MNILSYSEARASLRQVMDKVCEDHTPTVITSQNREAVVMISLADYNSMQETLHLMGSPANARRLNQSIAQQELNEVEQFKEELLNSVSSMLAQHIEGVFAVVKQRLEQQAATDAGTGPEKVIPDQPTQVNKQFTELPKVCDGKEQEAFERWAQSEGYEMRCHPLHYLFLDVKTYSARQGWKAALAYCGAQAESRINGLLLDNLKMLDELNAAKSALFCADQIEDIKRRVANNQTVTEHELQLIAKYEKGGV